jgi:hypothetical protein
VVLRDERLGREELKRVIEGKGTARRIPLAVHNWVYTIKVFGEREDDFRRVVDQYPADIQVYMLGMPSIFDAPKDDPSYRWLNYDKPPAGGGAALDAAIALDDWAKLDDVLADFPNPAYPGLITGKLFPDHSPPPDSSIYSAGHWSYCFFERLWSLRGMENALCDFYENPKEVHRLFRALTDFYKAAATRCKKELNADAIYTTDDIGTQTGPFFSLDIFREFFKPYYKELIDHTHSLGMHFWLHTCGNVKAFIPELIEIGLDVLHPIQKYTMDEREIIREFGGQICFWAGMDVQRIIPYGTPEDVRKEIRFLFDTYYRKDGRLILAAGNGFTADTPLENFTAMFDEALIYGTTICKGGI